MKYYQRTIIVKDYQGKWGKAVYVPQIQYFKTTKESFLVAQNKGKKIKFEPAIESTRKELRHLREDTVYTETDQLTDSQVYNRPFISKRGRW
nr:MAG TPA: hypothetical protein [Caudoviricetes sp.]